MIVLRCLAILFLFFVPDSATKFRLLADGRTEVPARKDYFTKKYREKYHVALPKNVEAGVLYTEVYYIDQYGGRYYLPVKHEHDYTRHLLFYENGCVNKFYLQPHKGSVNIDPEYSGYRGMVYTKNGKTYLSMVAFTNEVRELQNRRYDISFSGDTIFAKERWTGSKYAYLKDKNLPRSTYTANW